jgi:multidrug efflux pump subunit AcrB
LIRRLLIGGLLFGGLLLALGGLFRVIPTSFVPEEDQGYLVALGLLPDGASLDRTSWFRILFFRGGDLCERH